MNDKLELIIRIVPILLSILALGISSRNFKLTKIRGAYDKKEAVFNDARRYVDNVKSRKILNSNDDGKNIEEKVGRFFKKKGLKLFKQLIDKCKAVNYLYDDLRCFEGLFAEEHTEKNEEIQELREEYERVYSMGCCDEIDTQLEEIQKRIDELYNSEAIVPVNDLPIYNRKIYVYADIIAELKEANANADKAYKKFEKYFNKKLSYK